MRAAPLVKLYKILGPLFYGPDAAKCAPIPSFSARLELTVCIYPSHRFPGSSYPMCEARVR